MHYQDKVDSAAKKLKREEVRSKHLLNKSSYIKELREEMDDKPKEVSGIAGMSKKNEYFKEMEELEKVEN